MVFYQHKVKRELWKTELVLNMGRTITDVPESIKRGNKIGEGTDYILSEPLSQAHKLIKWHMNRSRLGGSVFLMFLEV